MEVKLAKETYELLNQTSFRIGMAAGAADHKGGMPIILLNDTLYELYVQLHEADPQNCPLEIDGDYLKFGGLECYRYQASSVRESPRFMVVPQSCESIAIIMKPGN